MAEVTVSFGSGNSLARDYANTDNLRADSRLFQALGASPENTEITVNGAPYSGPLYSGDRVV